MKQQVTQTKLSFLVVLLLLIVDMHSAYSQGYVAKESLEEDLDILKSNLEEIHPGLYTYTSKNRLDEWFIQTKENVQDSMNYYQFYELVAPLNSLIKNGHSFVALDRFKQDYTILPVRLYKYKDSFFVGDSFTEEYKEILGKEIVAINGVPIAEIFNKLLEFYTRDGENLSFPTEKLLHFFNLDYSLSYGSKVSYNITLLANSQQTEYTLKGISWKDISFYDRKPRQDYFDFSIKDSVATLKFLTFEKKDLRKIRYKKKLKEEFASMEKNNINQLIIDVRNNGGGDAVPNQELISYLYDKEFRLFRKIYTITNKISDKKNYKNEGVFLFNNILSWLKLKKICEDYYCVKTKGSNVYQPKANNYKGNLYILTNGRSFSATGEFTSFIKDHRPAVFIGEEVGGNKFQNASGIPYYVTLPNSKLRMLLPTILWELNVSTPNDGHGVTPDYWVRNTIQDHLTHTDSVMDFTLRLIRESTNIASMRGDDEK